jgi:hypothetical protein
LVAERRVPGARGNSVRPSSAALIQVVLALETSMWCRKSGQIFRLCRILCPEGTIGLSLGFRPQDTLTIGPALKGRQKFVEDLGRHSGRKMLFYRHPQGGRLLYSHPGLKPRAQSCSPLREKNRGGYLSAKSKPPHLLLQRIEMRTNAIFSGAIDRGKAESWRRNKVSSASTRD